MMLAKYKRRALIVALLLTVIPGGALVGHQLACALMLHASVRHLSEIVANNIKITDGVTDELFSTLYSLNRSVSSSCSPQDMEFLRETVLHSAVIQDAGRVRGSNDDGVYLCSALLSADRLAQLHTTHYANTLHGLRIHVESDLLTVNHEPMLMVEMGRSFVATGLYQVRKGVPAFVILTDATQDINGTYVGIPDEKHRDIFLHTGNYTIDGMLYATVCSTRYAHCQTGRVDRLEALGRNPEQIFGGGVTGGIFGLLALLYLLSRFSMGDGLAAQLQRAIKKNRLFLEYQPIVRMSDGKIIGAEALCRWKNEAGSMVAPDVFIRIAEEKQWISALTFNCARRLMQDWAPYMVAHPDFYISLNLSLYCLDESGFLSAFEQILTSSNVNPSSVVLEITESATARDSHLISHIQSMRQIGHRLYIDDFGTGYSSLSYLHELSVDAIKIDKAFTRAIGTEAVTVGILPQILSMAASMKQRVVVEGVETKAQADYLNILDRNLLGQGWFYGRPMSARMLEDRIAD